MKKTFPLLMAFFAFIASYFFIYWVPFSIIPGARNYENLPQIISLLIALLVGYFTWKKTTTVSNDLASSIITGGIIVGAIGFIAGFFGPMIFMPSANQGPLLGIFFTGPIGFVTGLIGGAIYWKLRVNK